jgi:3-methyladenine DNA glycosylase AlkD
MVRAEWESSRAPTFPPRVRSDIVGDLKPEVVVMTSLSPETVGFRDRVIDALREAGDPIRATRDKQYHKSTSRHWGVTTPGMRAAIATAMADAPPAVTLDVAAELWTSPIWDLRIVAPLMLTRKSAPATEPVWRFVTERMGDLDGWAIADTMAAVGARCLVADPCRLDHVETWVASPHLWTRRGSLVFTLPWTKGAGDPERMLGWAARLRADREWFIQKAIGWWLRELSKRDAPRARRFLEGPGRELKGVARREAEKRL